MLSALWLPKNNNSQPQVGSDLIDQNRSVLAAMTGEIALAVTVDIQPPNQASCPGPGFSTRSCARSHRATKCHVEVQHLLITSNHFLTPHSQLLAQPLRATHVWIAALIEAQESMYIAGQADTHAFANATGRLRGNTQPKRAVGTQI